MIATQRGVERAHRRAAGDRPARAWPASTTPAGGRSATRCWSRSAAGSAPTVGADDVAARLGGDEFAVVTVEGPVLAYALGTRLISALDRAVRAAGRDRRTCTPASASPSCAAGTASTTCCAAPTWPAAGPASSGRDRHRVVRLRPGGAARPADGPGARAARRGRARRARPRLPAGRRARRRPPGRCRGAAALAAARRSAPCCPASCCRSPRTWAIVDEVGQWVLRTACRQLAGWAIGRGCGCRSTSRRASSPRRTSSRGSRRRSTAHRIPPERLVVEVAEARIAADLPAVVTQLGRVCGRSAYGPRWTTSAPARRRWPTCAGCRSTSSRSTAPWSANRAPPARATARQAADRRGGQPRPPARHGDHRRGPGVARRRSTRPARPAAGSARASRWRDRRRPSGWRRSSPNTWRDPTPGRRPRWVDGGDPGPGRRGRRRADRLGVGRVGVQVAAYLSSGNGGSLVYAEPALGLTVACTKTLLTAADGDPMEDLWALIRAAVARR